MGRARLPLATLPSPVLLLLLLPPLLLGAGLLGCRGPAPRDVSVFYRYEPKLDGYDVTYPILLSSHTERPAHDFRETRVLWPFGLFRREGRETENRLYPFFSERRRVDRRGFIDYDLAIYPFVWYGTSADEGSYLAILPFGGTLKGFLGKDEIRIAMFPLYAWTRDKEFQSTHILFPFVNFVEGGGYSGFRVFPFYGHYEKVDRDGRPVYERSFALWPFVTWQRNALNSSRPSETLFIFPFYGRIDTPNTHQRTVLWPFFRYSENTRDPWWELRLFWPIGVISRGRDEERTEVWPFYGHKRRHVAIGSEGGYESYESRFFLFPIVRLEEQDSDIRSTTRQWVLPIFWRYEHRYKLEGESSHEWKVWPLVRYKRHRDGRVEVNVLSPLWFEDPEGFERIFDPLFRVYYHEARADGTDVTEAAFGLFQDRETPEESSLALHPFFFVDQTKDESYFRLGILFGLFQYYERGDETSLRFFWLPEWPTFGGGDDGE